MCSGYKPVYWRDENGAAQHQIDDYRIHVLCAAERWSSAAANCTERGRAACLAFPSTEHSNRFYLSLYEMILNCRKRHDRARCRSRPLQRLVRRLDLSPYTFTQPTLRATMMPNQTAIGL